jgi:uncharacterized protein YdeI (YjbR/CyaY-like superfamily)
MTEKNKELWKKPGEKFIEVFNEGDFSKWLEKNHDKEIRVGVIIHKKHTGKSTLKHNELMLEAICYGWIDTTPRRIDEDRFAIFFAKRNKNSKWSYNTLKYGEQLVKEKRMTSAGLKAFEEGKKKLPHDFGIPVNPKMPLELKKELDKNKTAKENFEKFSPSVKKTYFRWLLRAKLPETKKKRIDAIIKRSLNSTKPGTLSSVNN